MELNQTSSNISGVGMPNMPDLNDLDFASSQELQLQLSQVTQNLTHSVTNIN